MRTRHTHGLGSGWPRMLIVLGLHLTTKQGSRDVQLGAVSGGKAGTHILLFSSPAKGHHVILLEHPARAPQPGRQKGKQVDENAGAHPTNQRSWFVTTTTAETVSSPPAARLDLLVVDVSAIDGAQIHQLQLTRHHIELRVPSRHLQ